ncbi:MAG: collagenase, partial [Cytophagales bacterium]|nr:collagenase [Cytophagales bacterium]
MYSKKFSKHYLVIVLLLFASNINWAQQQPPATLRTEINHSCSRLHKHNMDIPGVNNSSINLKANARTAANCPSGIAGWASLSSSALITELKQATDYDDCFRVFYSFDSYYSPIIFTNTKIQAVANEMYSLSGAYDGTFSSGMYGLVAYLHAAIYHEFFQPSIELNAASKLRYRQACEAFAYNGNLFNSTEENLAVLDEYLIMLDYPGVRHLSRTIGVVKRAMRNLVINDTWKTISDNRLLRSYARAYNRIFFLMFRGMQPIDPDYEQAIANDSEFLDLLYRVGSDSELRANDELKFMSDNGVLELTRKMTSDVLKNTVQGYLAQIANQFPRLSVSWLRAVEAINKYGNCSAVNLCEDLDELREELKAILFPNRWEFDDGKLVMITPLTKEEVQPLYHAAKQVQAQFFRLFQTDTPVEGDINESLYMVIYGTLSDYQEYQAFLYNLPTNNGGIYIEKDATFYTYERTPAESIYTLEELFRHEYVHYLQGRYLEVGLWGQSPIYQDNRVVWFDEGMAEFFAGSTDTEGVRVRRSQANSVANDGTGGFMTVSEILNSNYNNGFKFYRYGNMLWQYWYENDRAKFKQFSDLTRAENIQGYDNLISQLKSSSALQSNYQNYLENIVNTPDDWWDPETAWRKDSLVAVGNLADIKDEFSNITGITDVTVTTDASSLNRRFRISGQISGQGSSNNNTTAAIKVNEALDGLMIQLQNDEYINNFDYSVAYFENVSYDGGNPSAEYHITGPLRSPNVGDNPVSAFTASRKATVEGGSIAFENQSSGYVKGFSWAFSGGSPSSSNERAPVVTYNTAGEYSVSLTANGKGGLSDTEAKSDFIRIYEKSNLNYCEASASFDYNKILRVQFGSIDNSSDWQDNGYVDYTSSLAEVSRGQSQTLAIELESEGWDLIAVGAWIDWNQDGDFEDSGEEIFRKFGPGPYSSNVTVPSDAVLGVTRMRIRMGYGSEDKIAACGHDTYQGEIEDYSVAIIEGGTNTDPPVADFNASSTAVDVGQSVSFSDLSSNNPTSWSWSFPGGTPASSTAQNPAVTYDAPGVFSVTLVASNNYGTDEESKSDFITVSAVSTSPEADFTASATAIIEGESVSFTDQSTNNPASWSWSFEGGTPETSTLQHPT